MTLFTTQERKILWLLAVTIVVGGLTGLARQHWLKSKPKYAAVVKPKLKSSDGTDPVKSSPSNVSENTTKATGEFVNINIANQVELESLPNIGPVTAKRIIDYRNDHGSFESVEDLTNVSGIGAKTLERIRPYIGL